MYIYHLNTHYMILLPEMYGYIKMQIMNCSIKKISDFDWLCLHQGTVNEASSLFTNIFIEFAKLCIPSKTIVVREDDKPWYDSEIRRNTRKRDRLKKTALKSGNQNDWKKNKYYRNKVNNQKKNAKEYFYNNLEIVSDFQNND